jgi:anhydro-N-acetylmuramic acid kinase
MSLSSKKYCTIGVMSGTSLDGLDLVCCNFWIDDRKWNFDVLATEEIPYDISLKSNLSNAFYQSEKEIQAFDLEYGDFIGNSIKAFIKKYNLRADLIASHGHTIFHRPSEAYTLQIGNGNSIAKITETLTINNFRAEDVKKGGQGAPLVPVGDKMLFSDFDICLNIGGIANISFDQNGSRYAFDVCPANQALNILAEKIGLDFDPEGANARSGAIISEILEHLNQLGYYKQAFPKSLGREWVETEFLPFLNKSDHETISLLRTVTEHIAFQIACATNNLKKGKMLITGGGAKNRFLIDRLKDLCIHDIVLPSKEIIDFKEAIVFAFLGVLKNRGEINCYASVTGASEDSSAGDLYFP